MGRASLNYTGFRVIAAMMIGLFFNSPEAFSNPGVTYQGRLLLPSGQPLTSSAVQFRIQIRTVHPENCLMYEETQVKNLSSTLGFFSITLNDGSATAVNTEPFTLAQVFQNRGVVSFLPGRCTGDDSFTLNPLASRQLIISFRDSLMGSWEQLPPQQLNFVPMALESVTVGGFRGGQLFRVVDVTGQPKNIGAWSEDAYTKLTGLVAGTENLAGSAAGFTGPLSGDVSGTQSATAVVRLQGRDLSNSAPTDGQALVWSQVNNRWEPGAVTGGGGGSTDWADITNKPSTFAPGGAATGDLAGSNYSNLVIANSAVSGAKIADGGVGYSKLAPGSAAGQVLQYSGTAWTAARLNFNDLVNDYGVSPWPGACGGGQYVTWVSVLDGFACVNLPTATWASLDGKPISLSGFGITDAIQNAGSTVSIQSGTLASRPAAGVAGRVFIATDTQEISRDNGAAWVIIGRGATGGGGTVTEVATGTGLTGGPISSTGTISIANQGVGAAQLADGAVTTAKVSDGQITDAKIAGVAVNKISSGAGLYLTYQPDGTACTVGQVLKWNNNRWECGADNNSAAGVTSVGVSVPAYMTSTGGPITSSGTIALGFMSQSANRVFAGPSSGTGVPSFRNLTIFDIRADSAGSPEFWDISGPCAAGEMPTYSAALDQVSCETYSITSSQVTSALGYTPLQSSDLSGYVPNTRTVTAGTGLAGGGDLSANRSLSIAAGGVGTTELASNAVTNAKIGNLEVTDAKIAGVAVSKISSGAGLYLTYQPNGSACTAGQVLKWQSSRWECANDNDTATAETDPTVAAFAKQTPNSTDFSVPGGELTLNTVPIEKGGTGAVTRSAALNNLLPNQATHSGKVLQSDGTNVSWVSPLVSTDYVAKAGDTMTGALAITGGSLLVSGATGTTPASGTGQRMMWVPAKAAFRAGWATNTEWNDANIGLSSAALGARVGATGSGSMAFGLGEGTASLGLTSSGPGSIAAGYAFGSMPNTTEIRSSGSGSVAMGHASGIGGSATLRSSGNGAIALGAATAGTLEATGAASVAIGENVRATAANAMALGKGFTNSTANTLQIGFTATPTLTVTGTRVGVGVSSPTEAVDVAGKVNATEFCLAGSCISTWPSGGGGSLTGVTGTANQISVDNTNPAVPALGLADLAVSPAGSYGSATQVPAITVDAKGRVTAVTNTTIDLSPVGKTLATNQVWIGNGSNQAAARFFGAGDLRNSTGTAQIPASCAASQTLTWSAITDVFNCTNISITTAQVSNFPSLGTAAAKNFGTAAGNLVELDGGSRIPASLLPTTALTTSNGFLQGGNSFGGAATLGTDDGFPLNLETDGTTRVTVGATGNVGVGVTTPAAKLDVAGEVKFGNTASTCNGTTEGQQRYNSTSKKMEFCNGTAWTEFGGGGGGSGISLKARAAFTFQFTSLSGQVSSVNTSTGVITWSTNHGLSTGHTIRSNGGTWPSPIDDFTVYYVRVLSATTFAVFLSAADAAANTNRVSLTAAGSGTRTAERWVLNGVSGAGYSGQPEIVNPVGMESMGIIVVRLNFSTPVADPQKIFAIAPTMGAAFGLGMVEIQSTTNYIDVAAFGFSTIFGTGPLDGLQWPVKIGVIEGL